MIPAQLGAVAKPYHPASPPRVSTRTEHSVRNRDRVSPPPNFTRHYTTRSLHKVYYRFTASNSLRDTTIHSHSHDQLRKPSLLPRRCVRRFVACSSAPTTPPSPDAYLRVGAPPLHSEPYASTLLHGACPIYPIACPTNPRRPYPIPHPNSLRDAVTHLLHSSNTLMADTSQENP